MISIIIPAYNCGNCITGTLDSLLAQTYRNFEIIIINDGSTDHTDEVIRKYMDQHRDVKISYKRTENAGPGTARNHGLSMAQGDYVTFVDSDDIVRPYYLKVLRNGMTDNVEFCFGRYLRIVDGNTENYRLMHSELDGIHPAQEVFVSFFGNKTYISLWNSIFSNAIIRTHQLRFIDGCYSGEDVEFIARYLMRCEKVNSIRDDIYTFHFDSLRAAKRMAKDATIKIRDSVYWNLVEATQKRGWSEGKAALERGKLPIEFTMKLLWLAREADSYADFCSKAAEIQKDYDCKGKLRRKYLRASTYYKARLALGVYHASPRLFYHLLKGKNHR